MTIGRTSPTTGEALEPIEGHSSDDVDALLTRAAETFEEWRTRDIGDREQLLERAGEILLENKEEYAAVITREMGKPISQSIAEVEKCSWVCDYYAEHAREHLQDEHVGTIPGAKTYVAAEPLGPVLAVMPWNYPFWQVFRFAAPALTAGNIGVLKHASNVPECARLIEDVFSKAGYPDGVFTSLLVGSSAVDDVIADDRIRAVTLTGSERAGRAVGSTAGENLKKTVLELGGSDPFIVLEDAPVDAACRIGEQARTQNSGQSCIAAKRFIVVEDVYDEFLEGLTDQMKSLTVGDPRDEETDVGPQARADLMAELHRKVEESVDAGAEIHLGGEPMDRPGNYYPPTILTDVPRDCPAATDELFGPVAAVFEVANEQDAVELANDSRFGLSASVWTEDRDRGERIATQLETGAAFVNQLSKSDPRIPFGGIKDSGYGRELARNGIREFVNEKTVWIE